MSIHFDFVLILGIKKKDVLKERIGEKRCCVEKKNKGMKKMKRKSPKKIKQWLSGWRKEKKSCERKINWVNEVSEYGRKTLERRSKKNGGCNWNKREMRNSIEENKKEKYEEKRWSF